MKSEKSKAREREYRKQSGHGGTPAKSKKLQAAGWMPKRTGHEPVYWRDPLGCLDYLCRTDEAYALQLKREKNGVA